MSNNNPLSDIFMMGIEKATYEEMLEIAKRKNKSVAEIASDALREHLQNEKSLNESRQRRVLTE